MFQFLQCYFSKFIKEFCFDLKTKRKTFIANTVLGLFQIALVSNHLCEQAEQQELATCLVLCLLYYQFFFFYPYFYCYALFPKIVEMQWKLKIIAAIVFE